MKAVRLVTVGAPLQMQDVPVPACGPQDVLVAVRAAGICHSDAHYRAGRSPVRPLPMTLGHEVAGVVEKVGAAVTRVKPGDRVCLHYNITCGDCYHCSSGSEQFCPTGLMIGHYTDGGYAQYIAVPARNALPLPEEIPFAPGATLMCASATAFHALRKSRLRAGETIAIIGVGGLGMSAVQLARAFGALDVFAVDIREESLALAARYGAVPVNAAKLDPVAEIRKLTRGRGADVAVEMLGRPSTMQQAVRCLGPLGRAVIVGIADEPLSIDSYHELLGNEAQIIGSNDHLLSELPTVIEMARRGILDVTRVVTRTIPLDAALINETLDGLERHGAGIRTVIVP
ncbi:MAG: zinc-binding dehydrogenase [Spirochaetia bacterium]|jgi:propanol-preferring alcohol dehydrogenase